MKILYFDCFSGIAGDMTVGALLDLGLPFDYLKGELAKLNLSGYELSAEKVAQHSISATKFNVKVTDDTSHRHLKHIIKIIDDADLSVMVKKIASRAFEKLAEAEASVHNSTPDKVHFHEVGGIDAIVDIVGSAIGVEYFNPDKIFAGSLTLGRGTAKSAHGIIPIPAPATVEILKGVPVRYAAVDGERVTPTGAAILTTLVEHYNGEFSSPELAVSQIGFGAGTKVYDDCPNLFRIVLGEMAGEQNSDTIEILETNIDDLNPQVYDYLFDRLYENGALEVFLIPTIMKKSRPGFILTVLCKKDLAQELSDIIFTETSTAGIRHRSQSRYILDRHEKIVKTESGSIRVKVLKLTDGFKIQPEYDDCRRAAAESGVPLKDIIDTVRRQAEIEEGHSDES